MAEKHENQVGKSPTLPKLRLPIFTCTHRHPSGEQGDCLRAGAALVPFPAVLASPAPASPAPGTVAGTPRSLPSSEGRQPKRRAGGGASGGQGHARQGGKHTPEGKQDPVPGTEVLRAGRRGTALGLGGPGGPKEQQGSLEGHEVKRTRCPATQDHRLQAPEKGRAFPEGDGKPWGGGRGEQRSNMVRCVFQGATRPLCWIKTLLWGAGGSKEGSRGVTAIPCDRPPRLGCRPLGCGLTVQG